MTLFSGVPYSLRIFYFLVITAILSVLHLLFFSQLKGEEGGGEKSETSVVVRTKAGTKALVAK